MKHFSLAAAIWGAVVVCLILISTNSVFAQFVTQTAQDIWTLPPLDCADGEQCEIRLSLEGDLFIYSTSTATLYTSRQGETTYSSYNLQPYVRWITGGVTEFVPFSDDNLVIFYGSADRTLSRLNLTTGEMTRMSQTDEHRRLLECNGYLGRGGNHQHISRLGTGSQLIFCALSDSREFLVNILDVVAGETLQEYNFALPWNGIGQPSSWNMLVGGQDGNIYIDAAGIYPRTIWQQLAGDVPALASWGWHLFRYEVNSGTWSVRSIVPEQMLSGNYPPSSGSALSRIGAILPNGDIVHQYEWSSSPSDTRITEVSLYRPSDFQLMDRISSQQLGRQAGFVGVSKDGGLLLASGTALSDLFIEQVESSSLAPTPTPAPTLMPTSTPAPTPGLLVSHTGPGTIFDDDGAHAAEGAQVGDRYSLRLAVAPTAPVTVTISSSSSPADVRLAGGARWQPVLARTITFQTGSNPNDSVINWDDTVTLSLTALADGLAEGAETHQILYTLTSADPAYNGLVVPSTPVTVYDSGVSISPLSLAADEGGSGAYSVVLAAPPGMSLPTPRPEAVTVALNASGAALSGLPASLTFTRANWNIPQVVAFTAPDDGIANTPPVQAVIAHAVSSDITTLASHYSSTNASAPSVTVAVSGG